MHIVDIDTSGRAESGRLTTTTIAALSMADAPASSASKPTLQEVLPKAGLVYSEKGNLSEVLCKPKIMPIKSLTLEKIEDMEAQTARQPSIPATALKQ